MLNFFKRAEARSDRPVSKPTVRPARSKGQDRRALSGPLPVPEVIEGNEDSDWALWEESVSFQNSQMPSLSPPIMPRAEGGNRHAESGNTDDAFSSVHKHTP